MFSGKNWSFTKYKTQYFGLIIVALALYLIVTIKMSDKYEIVETVIVSGSTNLSLVESLLAVRKATGTPDKTESEKTEKKVLRRCNQSERLQYITEKCQQNFIKTASERSWNLDKRPLFIVDEEHKLAYCHIPKTGSSTLKTLIMISTRIGRQMPPPRYSHQNIDLISRGLKLVNYTKELDTYTKFMVVRNPYERIVSAYMEKIVPPKHVDPFYRRIKRWMLQRLGKNPWEQVNFKEFVRMIKYLQSRDGSITYDSHWYGYMQRCNPCKINYNFVLRLETFAEDMDLILPILNQTRQVLRNTTRNASNKDKTRPVVQTRDARFGKQIDLIQDLSNKQVKWLRSFYRKEDSLFGYGLTKKRSSFCSISTDSGEQCC